ncbi:MAG: phosphatase PAP2 family protein [Deltaproteobacteria bacterium]|nr:phosphatase PAP2 family protein [Deltaproteobacteria bacterium]
MDYACRDNYGLRLEETSAWAGISYFGSRIAHLGDGGVCPRDSQHPSSTPFQQPRATLIRWSFVARPPCFLLFGRPRLARCRPTGEGFRDFFEVSPGVGDFSFPSGHVAVAMALAPWAWLLWREGRTRAALVVGGATLGWAGAVAYGRVLYGAHFLTDVVFSVGLGVALAPLSLISATFSGGASLGRVASRSMPGAPSVSESTPAAAAAARLGKGPGSRGGATRRR